MLLTYCLANNDDDDDDQGTQRKYVLPYAIGMHIQHDGSGCESSRVYDVRSQFELELVLF